MKNNSKRGFTIVELIIVIAVIAILAATLIPTFSGLIRKAEEAKDTALVRNLNEALAMDTTGKHETMYAAVKAAAANGIDLTKHKATIPGNVILWDSENDLFAYYKVDEDGENGKINYIPEYQPAKQLNDAYKFWTVTDDISALNGPYSVYWNGAVINDEIVKVGFDSGDVKVNKITYKRTSSDPAINVTIHTNSPQTTLVVDTVNGNVSHYGKLGKLEITEVPYDCYYEFGTTAYAEVTKGKLVANNGGSIEIVHTTAPEAAIVTNGGTIGGAYCVGSATEYNNFSNGKGGNVAIESSTKEEIEVRQRNAIGKAIENEEKSNLSGVQVSGISGYEGAFFATVEEAYNKIKPTIDALSGLGQDVKCTPEQFDEVFTDGGKITWIIYGKQKLVATNDDKDDHTLSFGRAASYYGQRSLTELSVIGGNDNATLDLTGTDGTFALPYNWWGKNVKNIAITLKGVAFDGIKSIPGTWAEPGQETSYTFENCIFNGKVYGYHDYNINLTIKNSKFNAPANTDYAIMLQSTTNIDGKVTIDGCTFNGYTRGVNLQRPNTEFIFTNNTIKSNCSKKDRGAIQLTDGKSFVVNGNTIQVNEGNAFWFHDAATNANVTYTINNNNIKAKYLGYSGVTAFDVNTKITSSGNIFNSTDTANCMKKNATVAEATNLTAIK